MLTAHKARMIVSFHKNGIASIKGIAERMGITQKVVRDVIDGRLFSADTYALRNTHNRSRAVETARCFPSVSDAS